MSTHHHRGPVEIVVCEDGPLLVRGSYTLKTTDGRVIDPRRATVALCRCGRSRLKPFCDGAHKTVGPAPRTTGALPRDVDTIG